MNHDDDNPDQRPKRLESLRSDRRLPGELEDRVVRSLAARGRLRAPGRRLPWTPLTMAAVALLAFWLGRAAGGSPTQPEPPAARQRWLLLLYEDSTFEHPPSGSSYSKEYGDWARALARSGRLVDGEELAPRSFLVDPASSGSDTTNADHPTLGTLAGFFLIEAVNREEIERIARTSPHHVHRGRIVLRRVVASAGGDQDSH